MDNNCELNFQFDLINSITQFSCSEFYYQVFQKVFIVFEIHFSEKYFIFGVSITSFTMYFKNS